MRATRKPAEEQMHHLSSARMIQCAETWNIITTASNTQDRASRAIPAKQIK